MSCGGGLSRPLGRRRQERFCHGGEQQTLRDDADHLHEAFRLRQLHVRPQRLHGLPGLVAEVVEGLVLAFPAVPRPVFRLSVVMLSPRPRSPLLGDFGFSVFYAVPSAGLWCDSTLGWE